MNVKDLLRSSPGNYNTALLIIRVVVGLTFFMHGIQKFFLSEGGVSGFGGWLGSMGVPLPAVAGVIVALLEVFGGLALILGIGTRIVGWLLAVNMLVALLLVHVSNGFFAQNGGYELVLLLGVSSAALAMSGSGALSLDAQIAEDAELAPS